MMVCMQVGLLYVVTSIWRHRYGPHLHFGTVLDDAVVKHCFVLCEFCFLEQTIAVRCEMQASMFEVSMSAKAHLVLTD